MTDHCIPVRQKHVTWSMLTAGSYYRSTVTASLSHLCLSDLFPLPHYLLLFFYIATQKPVSESYLFAFSRGSFLLTNAILHFPQFLLLLRQLVFFILKLCVQASSLIFKLQPSGRDIWTQQRTSSQHGIMNPHYAQSSLQNVSSKGHMKHKIERFSGANKQLFIVQ